MHLERKYPSKVLLFGEHSVLIGSSALAVHYPKYFMKWVIKTNDHPEWLLQFVNYVDAECSSFIDFDQLTEWLNEYTITANIPIGFGLGSSGALTAAIYDVAGDKNISNDISEIQQRFGLMESFFHGKSSGFDPLISYYNVPILKTNEGITLLQDQITFPTYFVYLLNSDQPRQGKGMIGQFLSKKDELRIQYETLISLNNKAIHKVIENDQTGLFSVVKEISNFQATYMEYMIIPELMSWWKEGLSTNQYYIKVCGAGGGGYYLVFSKNELDSIGQFKLERITF